MRREELVDLNAFLMVADTGNFTRAAALLGTSQSALSHTIRRLETRLGVRLLTRTTRSVSLTEAGDRLSATLRPALDSIATELASLGDLRERPAGTIRITAAEHASNTVVWPALQRLLPRYPDIHVELSIDSGFVDIVKERFAAVKVSPFVMDRVPTAQFLSAETARYASVIKSRGIKVE